MCNKLQLKSVMIIDGSFSLEESTLSIGKYEYSFSPDFKNSVDNTKVVFIPLAPEELPDKLSDFGVEDKIITEFVSSGFWAFGRYRGRLSRRVYAFILSDSDSPSSWLPVHEYLLLSITILFGAKVRSFDDFSMGSKAIPHIGHGSKLVINDGILFDFVLNKEKTALLEEFINNYKDHLPEKEFLIALRYIERAHQGEHPIEDRILYLSIALEALLLEAEAELSHRISLRTSFMITNVTDVRTRIYNLVSNCYKIRSEVAHGTFVGFDKKILAKFKKIKTEEIFDEFSWVVREVFVRRLFSDKSKEEVIVELHNSIMGNTSSIQDTNKVRVYKKEEITIDFINEQSIILNAHRKETGDMPSAKWSLNS